MDIFVVLAFVLGTGFGWCFCSLVDILLKYLDMKRCQKKSEKTWNNLRPYLKHCMKYTEGGIAWVSYDELRERRKKQDEQNIQQHVRGNSEETSSAS